VVLVGGPSLKQETPCGIEQENRKGPVKQSFGVNSKFVGGAERLVVLVHQHDRRGHEPEGAAERTRWTPTCEPGGFLWPDCGAHYGFISTRARAICLGDDHLHGNQQHLKKWNGSGNDAPEA
jgi:hypothetical protein